MPLTIRDEVEQEDISDGDLVVYDGKPTSPGTSLGQRGLYMTRVSNARPKNFPKGFFLVGGEENSGYVVHVDDVSIHVSKSLR